jgi:acyl transferase domain-containing protein
MSGFERKSSDIAVIGMACHLPEADSIEEFWNVLLQGKDCISRSEEKKDFGFVPAYGKLENVYDFDYSFFGFSKQEASMMDPQQRIFMQTVYEAMEDAGCLGGEDEVTGLFAGSDEFKYVWERILTGERQEMEYTVRKLYLNNSFVSRICYTLQKRSISR